MAVKDSNSRIIITIPTELKNKLELASVKDKRTVSKEVEFILEQYLNNNDKSKQLG